MVILDEAAVVFGRDIAQVNEVDAVRELLDHPGQVDLAAVPGGVVAVEYAPARPAQVGRRVELK
jgi:hypothetical protein